jgi:predicted aspartyl protease
MRQGALSKEDFEGNVEKILENNQVQDGAVVNIKQLRIGYKSIEDVKLMVRKDVRYSLSLGQEILNEFGAYEIDDVTKQVIFK